jgi:hypothetical protein
LTKRKANYRCPFGDARRGIARRFATRQRQIAARFLNGVLPPDAVMPAQACGCLEIDTERVRQELEHALGRRRMTQVRRLRRTLAGMSRELRALQQQLDYMVEHQPRPDDWLSQLMAASRTTTTQDTSNSER